VRREISRKKKKKQNKEKGPKMKTASINKLARVSGIAIALALFAAIAGEVKAETAFKGGASQLTVRAAAVTSAYKPMSCATCNDKFVTRKDLSARGANKPDVTVARHFCNGCETTMATVGQGKAGNDVATHKCASGTPGCCSTKSGS